MNVAHVYHFIGITMLHMNCIYLVIIEKFIVYTYFGRRFPLQRHIQAQRRERCPARGYEMQLPKPRQEQSRSPALPLAASVALFYFPVFVGP
jgi:hypothetical protein